MKNTKNANKIYKRYLILGSLACLALVILIYYCGIRYDLYLYFRNIPTRKSNALCSFFHRGAAISDSDNEISQHICHNSTNKTMYLDFQKHRFYIAHTEIMTKNPIFDKCGLQDNLQYAYITNTSNGQKTLGGKKFNIKKHLIEEMGIPMKEKV